MLLSAQYSLDDGASHGAASDGNRRVIIMSTGVSEVLQRLLA